MNIAIITYIHRHGQDSILVRTEKSAVEDLPPITNDILKLSGVYNPDVDGPNPDEDAEWYAVYPIDELPILEDFVKKDEDDEN